MTTLYLIVGLILAVGLSASLAWLAGRAAGRGESAAHIARLTVERESALSARDAATRIAQAAADAPGDVDAAIDILKRHEVGA